MTELPDYLKEIEELEERRDPNKIFQSLEFSFEYLNKIAIAFPRILSDFKKLQKDKAELIKALEQASDRSTCIKKDPKDSDFECSHCMMFEALERIKGEKE